MNQIIESEQFILDLFKEENLEQKSIDYIKYHYKRYILLVNLISSFSKNKHDIKLLDIGPFYQTYVFRKLFKNFTIDTLGYKSKINTLREGEKHIKLDLNYCEEDTNPILTKYDIIIFAEVIEHLYTKPEIILDYVKKYLKDDGIIILQTPNGVNLSNRIEMLRGRNPFHLIHENRQNHYREYTLKELYQIVENCQLVVKSHFLSSYFSPPLVSKQLAIYHKLIKYLPNHLQDGITLVIGK